MISISWGAAESELAAQALRGLDQAFADAAALGVTVCCAAGDDGSDDDVGDGRAHVDFPASSPYALACGGTRLDPADAADHERGRLERTAPAAPPAAASASSSRRRVPAGRAGCRRSANPEHKVGRGVPDVAGDADPVTGYKVRVDGQDTVIGGTSAVAPL